ncbi:MAG: outer membrane homotrimeric porin [Desulfovibrionaceae bacterium]|nr:outer membrane homotrimeric porin [Desulfovibrionaceae bacterium]
MKKLVTLLLAAGLAFGAAAPASAIDFKAKGEWMMSFEYGQNGNFQGGHGQTGYDGSEDEFNAEQRVRLQLDAVASENLMGEVYFEIGSQNWGQASTGGALGADGTVVEVRRAFIDWAVPGTELKIRMGIQGFNLPSFAMDKSQIFTDDIAGITFSYKFCDNAGLTGFWFRPYNDNYKGRSDGSQANYMDNVDAFGLTVPLTFDGVSLTPYGMVAAIGPNALRGTENHFDNDSTLGASRDQLIVGLLPAWGYAGSATAATVKLDQYATAWWAGLTGDITAFDPIHIAFDVMGGAVQWDESRLNRAGWLAAALVEYKTEWAIPGIVGWYASGDDDDLGNGSERMPFLGAAGADNQFSNYAFDGIIGISREGAIGTSMAGTWGAGLRVRDISFCESLKHTFRFNVIGGTNSDNLLKKIRTRYGDSDLAISNSGRTYGVESLYMTTMDTALEFGLETIWQIYDNMQAVFNADYINLTQQGNSKVVNGDLRDAWNLSVYFTYEF